MASIENVSLNKTMKLPLKSLQKKIVSEYLSTVAVLGFQFGLYHVVVPLSFLRSISLASLFYSFYFWLIRSFTDATLTGNIFVCGPLHHFVNLVMFCLVV